MRKYKLIGLTGQSGAGKSTVARIFADSGLTVISADEIVAALYSKKTPCVKTIAAQFGDDVLNDDGTPNRRLLAQRAFASKQTTELLNSIVHPFVTAELFARLRGEHGVVVYDAPQLFESGADVICDMIIGVTADEGIRLERIMQRDGLCAGDARKRINAQLDEEFFRRSCDTIIQNNGDINGLRAAAEALAHSLTEEVS